MITVLFQNVGRNRLNWSARLRMLNEESVRNQARRHLLAQHLDIQFDASGLAGKIYIAGREVGAFQAQARQ